MYYGFKIKGSYIVEGMDMEKKFNEEYLTDDDLFANVELKALQVYKHADTECTAIYRSPICEVVNDEVENGKWYDATVAEEFLLDSGKTKKMKYHMLVSGTSVDDATERVNEHFKQGYGDMTLEAIKLTHITHII